MSGIQYPFGTDVALILENGLIDVDTTFAVVTDEARVLLYDLLVRREKFSDALVRQFIPGLLSLLLLLGFVGGCAGSTSGGMKVARLQMVVPQRTRDRLSVTLSARLALSRSRRGYRTQSSKTPDTRLSSCLSISTAPIWQSPLPARPQTEICALCL